METLLTKYVINGGVLMGPLILCSILTVGYTLQGLIRLRRRRVIPPALLAQARQAGAPITRRPYILSMRTNGSPLGRAVWFALKTHVFQHRSPDPTEIDALVEDATAQAVDEMYDMLGPLGTIYTIAPLLGLLGTIHGMVLTFYDFGVRQERSIEVLAVGIQEALITTLWGLPIAIVAYLAAQWLEGRIKHYERHELPVAVREIVVSLHAPAPDAPPADDISTTPALGGVQAETRA